MPRELLKIGDRHLESGRDGERDVSGCGHKTYGKHTAFGPNLKAALLLLLASGNPALGVKLSSLDSGVLCNEAREEKHRGGKDKETGKYNYTSTTRAPCCPPSIAEFALGSLIGKPVAPTAASVSLATSSASSCARATSRPTPTPSAVPRSTRAA